MWKCNSRGFVECEVPFMCCSECKKECEYRCGRSPENCALSSEYNEPEYESRKSKA